MSQQPLVSYIKQLGADLELESPLEADKSQSYTLVFNKTLSISIKALQNGTFFFTTLGEIPIANCEEFFIYAMHANLLGLGTGDGVIGLDREGKMLTFSLNYPYQVTYDTFKEQLEEFVNWTDLWQKKSQDARVKA